MPDNWLFCLFLLFVLLIFIIYSLKKADDRELASWKNEADFEKYAKTNGLEFKGYIDGGFKNTGFRGEHISGNSKRQSNVLGKQGNIEFVFGLCLSTSSYNIRRRRPKYNNFLGTDRTYYDHITTHDYIGYCLVKCPDIEIPHFFMSDEHLGNAIYEMFGGQDIDFDGDNDFSSSFVLKGDHEEKIRRAFTPEIRKLFLKLSGKGYSFEGVNESIIIFSEKYDLSSMKSIYTTAIKIAEAFTKSCRSNRKTIQNNPTGEVPQIKQSNQEKQISPNSIKQSIQSENIQQEKQTKDNLKNDSTINKVVPENKDNISKITKISDLKNKPGLMEILNQNRKNKNG